MHGKFSVNDHSKNPGTKSLFLYRSVKLDSSTVPYVQRLSVSFFSGVEETAGEFGKAFNNAKDDDGEGDSRTSAFLTWIDEEIDGFCQRVEKQVRSESVTQLTRLKAINKARLILSLNIQGRRGIF